MPLPPFFPIQSRASATAYFACLVSGSSSNGASRKEQDQAGELRLRQAVNRLVGVLTVAGHRELPPESVVKKR
jgi:hypothetical protein